MTCILQQRDSLVEQRHRRASLALLHHVGLVPQRYAEGGGCEAARLSVHLNRQRLEGGEDHLSALMQPLTVTAHLQRRLQVKMGNTCKSWALYFILCLTERAEALTSEAMVKPITSMQPSSCLCGSKSLWSPVLPHGMVPAQYLQTPG